MKNRPVLVRMRLGVVLLTFVLPVACMNPFKPADPERPDGGGIIEDFRSPEGVLETLALAIQSKSTGGANAYLRAFADSTVLGDRAYRCIYDDAVKKNWQSGSSQTAPEPWDLSLERGVHGFLSTIRPTYSYAFQWTDDPGSENDGDPAAADTVLYHRKYTLLATSADGNFNDIIATGFADLSFQKTGGRWSIFRWNDRVDPQVGVNPAATDERTMSWWRLESRSR